MTVDRTTLVRQATLAPSVHNVQPARWRLVNGNELLLLEDKSVRLLAGDPTGHDARISLGAAAEGLRLAASRHGLSLQSLPDLPQEDDELAPIAVYRLVPDKAAPDPLAELVDARRSWRGAFAPATAEDRKMALALASEDSTLIADPEQLRVLAKLAERASYQFLADQSFRRELLSWMRFSSRHPGWNRDGLNAEAMAMGRIEAIGAGLVLGPLFVLLHRLRLAAPLVSEADKMAGACGLLLFHRPQGEDPFVSGAHFYRCWLRIEEAGFGAAVVAALADHRPVAEEVTRLAALPSGRRLVSSLRIGRRPAGSSAPRARRPIGDVLV
jgi:hypothetical protein